MKRLVLVAVGLLALGCDEQREVVKNIPKSINEIHVDAKTPKEIVKDRLDRICMAYESEQCVLSPCEMDGFAQISCLSKAEERLACARYFIGRLLSLKIDHLSYVRQSDVINFSGRAIENVRAVLPRDDAGWEERYDLDLKLLDWRKAHVDRVRRKLPEKMCAESRCDEAEESGRSLIYFGGIKTYESSLRDLETLFPYKQRQMSDEAWNRIKAKVEAYLGRPLRTREQLRADHKAKRNVVFTEERGYDLSE